MDAPVPASSPPPTPAKETRSFNVALIGNPNTGKSTLFNLLCGLQSRVGNFPGVTVEKKIGHVQWQGQQFNVIDLPGTYSLSPRTLDEMVSVDVLLGRQKDVGHPDAVVCIVDASNLERNLYLVSQVLDMQLPVVVVLNMCDVALARGTTIDATELSQRLGVPVVKAEAHRAVGIDDIRNAIAAAAKSSPVETRKKVFPAEFYSECDQLAAHLNAGGAADVPEFLIQRMILDPGGCVEAEYTKKCGNNLPQALAECRERLKSAGQAVPAIEARQRYAWIREVLDGIHTRPTTRSVTFSDKLDRVLTHKLIGVGIFIALMFVVFQAIYAWAGPFMEVIETAQGWLADLVAMTLAPGPLRSLINDGVIAGVGGVIVFLPQIVFLFLFIAILEDCGYMARAAFLMDRLMTKVGLSGKSFVPLMSSFACAIPGVMATRVIENRRDRMVTILVAPLMSCSARLPVYILLIAAFIPAVTLFQVGPELSIGDFVLWSGQVTLPGVVLLAMSSLGAVIAVPVAWILKKTMFRGETPPFIMELPSYKWPSPRIVFHRVYDRAKAFVMRAGTLIFATTIIVWAAGYFPGDHTAQHKLESQIEALDDTPENEAQLEQLVSQHNAVSAQLIETSFLGRVGHAIEPAVKPLGWDWRIGVGAVASFPAREVIISTLGTIYSMGGDVDEESEGLKESLQQARWPDGRNVYNVPVALSIMVFFALCAQCGATLMVIRRETNSWFWPVFTFVYMTALAYVAALLVYQVGMRYF
ncbi:ferrous iron transport protein B [Symmachiella dynata]|uniref:ferrous iron transport protein B n=1 Tax=Symmachiella dynata TaxID=2527995 RepID=UPI0030EC28DC